MRKDINEYYRALGIAPGAEPAQIRRAYRQLVQQWHPDLFKPGSPMQTTAEDITKEINEAYEQLYRKGLHRKFRPVAVASDHPEDSGAGNSPDRKPEPVRSRSRPARTNKAAARKPRDRSPKKEPTARPGRSRKFSPVFWAKAALAAAALLAVVAVSSRIRNGWVNLSAQSAVPGGAHSAGVLASSRVAEPLVGQGKDPIVQSAPQDASTADQSSHLSRQIQRADLGSLPDYIVPYNADQEPAYGRSDAATLFKRAESLLDVFDVGDSKARVIQVQGPPDDSAENIFRYGSSLVYFKNGVVKSWSIGLPRLRVHLWPSLDLSLLDRFSLGSSRVEVIRAQGDPTAFTQLGYFYGTSAVYFDNDRVSGWSRGDVALRDLDMPLLPFFELDSAIRR
jgi:curved DNA-binding protein CbpA